MGQIVEDFLKLNGLRAKQHDVAGGTVHVGQAGAAKFPDIAHLAEIIRRVVLARGLGHAHGVEVRHAREHLGLVAVAADDAAAVTEHADDAAVLPVRFPFLVGKFKHAEQVFGAIRGDLVVDVVGVLDSVRGFLLDVGHKAGPWPGLKLIQLRGWMFSHCRTSLMWLSRAGTGASKTAPLTAACKDFPFF